MRNITIDRSYFKIYKEEVKEVIQEDRFAITGLMWRQADGDYIRIGDMSLSHIVNTCKLLMKTSNPTFDLYAGVKKATWLDAFQKEIEYRSKIKKGLTWQLTCY